MLSCPTSLVCSIGALIIIRDLRRENVVGYSVGQMFLKVAISLVIDHLIEDNGLSSPFD